MTLPEDFDVRAELESDEADEASKLIVRQASGMWVRVSA